MKNILFSILFLWSTCLFCEILVDYQGPSDGSTIIATPTNPFNISLLINSDVDASITWELKILNSSNILIRSFSGSGNSVLVQWDGTDTNSNLIQSGSLCQFNLDVLQNSIHEIYSINYQVKTDTTKPTFQFIYPTLTNLYTQTPYIEIKLNDISGLNWNSFQISINNQNKTSVFQRTNNTVFYQITDSDALPLGITTWNLQISDTQNNVLNATGQLNILLGQSTYIERSGLAKLDLDNDALDDDWEINQELDPSVNDSLSNIDNDLLSNIEEFYAGTNPNIADQNISNHQLISLIQKLSFLFFKEHQKQPYGFIPDTVDLSGNTTDSSHFSIAGIGYSLIAWVVADYYQWISHDTAYQNINTIIQRFLEIQNQNDPLHSNKNGIFYHFVDQDGLRFDQSEISSIDHALFLAGVILAKEYYPSTELSQAAETIFSQSDWSWMVQNNSIFMGWFPGENIQDTGTWDRNGDQWNRYSELMILLIQAIANQSISNTSWNDFTRNTITYEIQNTPITYIHSGALFTHQFSHMFIDFRNKTDLFDINYFENSIKATYVNREFAIDIANQFPDKYEYDSLNWGLSSADASSGYMVLQPDFDNYYSSNFELVEHNTDSGTMVPSAVIGSLPFAPEITLDTLSHFYHDYHDSIWYSKYGFINSFNHQTANSGFSHYSTKALSIDMGLILGMIENFKSGLLWKFFMQNESIKTSMQSVGFNEYNPQYQLIFEENSDINTFFTTEGSVNLAIDSGESSVDGITNGFPLKAIFNENSSFRYTSNLNLTYFDQFDFWIKLDSPSTPYSLYIEFTDSWGKTYELPMIDFIFNNPVDWYHVKIPLWALSNEGLFLQNITSIDFKFKNFPGIVWFDNFRFQRDKMTPRPPIGPYLANFGDVIKLRWHPWKYDNDILKYDIFKANNDIYEALNDTLILSNQFTDTSSILGNTCSYKIKLTDNSSQMLTNNSTPQTIVHNGSYSLDYHDGFEPNVFGGYHETSTNASTLFAQEGYRNGLAYFIRKLIFDLAHETISYNLNNADIDPNYVLKITLKSSSANSLINLYLEDSDTQSTVLLLNDYLLDGNLNSQYQTIDIPLSHFQGINYHSLDKLTFELLSDQPTTLYIDTILFTNPESTLNCQLRTIDTNENAAIIDFGNISFENPITIAPYYLSIDYILNPNQNIKIYSQNINGKGLRGTVDNSFFAPLIWGQANTLFSYNEIENNINWKSVIDITENALTDPTQSNNYILNLSDQYTGTQYIYYKADFSNLPSQNYQLVNLTVEVTTND